MCHGANGKNTCLALGIRREAGESQGEPEAGPNHRLQATGNSLRSYVAAAAPRA